MLQNLPEIDVCTKNFVQKFWFYISFVVNAFQANLAVLPLWYFIT